MTDTPRNIRNAIKSFVPNWLSDRRGLNVGFAILYTIALLADMFVEQLFQGTLAPLPGQGDPSTLAYIGRSRGLIRGIGEADARYIVRLLAWLDTWTLAGGAETLVILIQAVLGGNLVVRLIDRAGNCVTANADNTTTKTTFAGLWDWDSEIQPASKATSRAGFWGDTWLVVYTTDGRWPVYSSRSDPAFLAAWGTYDGLGYGHQVPRDAVDIVYQVLAAFKGAHMWVAGIVFTDDTTLFVPGGDDTYPGGAFGNWSHHVPFNANSNPAVPARLVTSGGHYVRYWIPRFGG